MCWCGDLSSMEARNYLHHGNSPRSEEAILVQIMWEVRGRVLAKGRFKNFSKDLSLVYRWNLHSLLQLLI